MTTIDSAMFVVIIVLVVAFLAIAVVAIHWIVSNQTSIDKNTKQIQNLTKVEKKHEISIYYLNKTIMQGR